MSRKNLGAFVRYVATIALNSYLFFIRPLFPYYAPTDIL
jgi:hypothetical protein